MKASAATTPKSKESSLLARALRDYRKDRKADRYERLHRRVAKALRPSAFNELRDAIAQENAFLDAEDWLSKNGVRNPFALKVGALATLAFPMSRTSFGDRIRYSAGLTVEIDELDGGTAMVDTRDGHVWRVALPLLDPK